MLPILEIAPWNEEKLSVFAEKILRSSHTPLVLIDGKGGSGKTSFAVKLAEVLGADIVSTDDVAWHTDPIHWDTELLNGIIRPWLCGENVAYTPSGWIKKNRVGFIAADSRKPLIVEGCGACRKTLRAVASFSVWIDTDPNICRERVIKRDLANGENGGTIESVGEFTDWFDSLIDPFLAEEESWKYANAIVSGIKSDLSSCTLSVHYPISYAG